MSHRDAGEQDRKCCKNNFHGNKLRSRFFDSTKSLFTQPAFELPEEKNNRVAGLKTGMDYRGR
jgi:hypothetical protein